MKNLPIGIQDFNEIIEGGYNKLDYQGKGFAQAHQEDPDKI